MAFQSDSAALKHPKQLARDFQPPYLPAYLSRFHGALTTLDYLVYQRFARQILRPPLGLP